MSFTLKVQMFLEKAIYSSNAKSNTKYQEIARPTVALIVEAGKLILNSISSNTRVSALYIWYSIYFC